MIERDLRFKLDIRDKSCEVIREKLPKVPFKIKEPSVKKSLKIWIQDENLSA